MLSLEAGFHYIWYKISFSENRSPHIMQNQHSELGQEDNDAPCAADKKEQ